MTEKEVRKLSRAELLEMLVDQGKQVERLQMQVEELEEALASRELKVNKAGSIAEAALAVNGVFEAAQAAADQYVQEVKRSSEEIEERIRRSKQQASTILRQADAEAEKRKQQADAEIASKWAEFRQKVSAAMRDYDSLQGLVGGADVSSGS